jgi:hypothetical protein
MPAQCTYKEYNVALLFEGSARSESRDEGIVDKLFCDY